DGQYRTALAEPVVSKDYGPQNQVDAPYVAEMARAELIRRFGPAAYTAGLKVTTTIDSRLQRAANRAIRETLTAYDERHRYRARLAPVDLPAPSTENAPAAAAGLDTAKLDALLEDQSLLDFEAAVVLGVEPQSARVYFAHGKEEMLGFDAVAWAA